MTETILDIRGIRFCSDLSFKFFFITKYVGFQRLRILLHDATTAAISLLGLFRALKVWFSCRL